MKFRPAAMLAAFALVGAAAFAPAQTTPAGSTPPVKQERNPFDDGSKSAIAAAPVLDAAKKEEILKALEDVVTRQAFVPGVDLSKWPEYLEKRREDLDKAEKETEFARAVNAAMRDFGISHIRFVTTRASQARRQTTTIGIGVQARKVETGLQVVYVYPKSPADSAGIKNGETIVRVDGKDPDSTANLQGEDGTEATLVVKTSEGTEREVKLKRAAYSVARADTLSWIGTDSAVMKVHSFSRGYERSAIENLVAEAEKAKYLVIDLRSNGGGAVANLNHFLSLLLPDKTEIGTFVYRRTSDKYAEDHAGVTETDPVVIAKASTEKFRTNLRGSKPFAGKVAVLINRGSASASEIFAAALRENLGAPIVGGRSAGAVLASVYRRLPHGYEIQYPISDYVTKDGLRLEKNPIVPDVEVSEPAADGKDPVVEAALAKLRGE
jgi:carboxyl-terminal processing protease